MLALVSLATKPPLISQLRKVSDLIRYGSTGRSAGKFKLVTKTSILQPGNATTKDAISNGLCRNCTTSTSQRSSSRSAPNLAVSLLLAHYQSSIGIRQI